MYFALGRSTLRLAQNGGQLPKFGAIQAVGEETLMVATFTLGSGEQILGGNVKKRAWNDFPDVESANGHLGRIIDILQEQKGARNHIHQGC